MNKKTSTLSLMHTPGAILLISCYELGHRPIGLTRPLNAFEEAGFLPHTIDIAVEPLDTDKVQNAKFIGISVPMHTALRLGVHLLQRIRDLNPDVVICMYGLYAELNADYLYSLGVDYCIGGGDVSIQLVELVQSLEENEEQELPAIDVSIGKLPTLEKYAQFEDNGEVRHVGYTETTHGCKHLCTHCPIPPVYNGKFSPVPQEIVLKEIHKQVAEGATHITFGDPDFLNGPLHGLRILRAMHETYPDITFDFTTKIEHILKHGKHFPEFAELGCRFVISAVESLSETVLTILEKQHTRSDVEDAIEIVHGEGIALRPTWVPFTPWTTLADYLEILKFVDTHGLVYHVDPVQFAVRLLIPPGSYLLNRTETKALPLTLDETAFSYIWVHPDTRMDELHKTVNSLVENDTRTGVDFLDTFYRIWEVATGLSGKSPPKISKNIHLAAPRITEAWFC
ncbi:radical SAM protein [Candidatus Poribacteria bacterium]|nr:MAG: radical SAM protein [Candidatus Poribacteria bacterium]